MTRSLSESRLLRFITFGALYLGQGIPWGFISVGYVVLLSDAGLDNEAVGAAMSWAYLPWSFKILWGPLIDRFPSRRFGRRRPYIAAAEFLMGLTLVALLFVDPAAQLGVVSVGLRGPDTSMALIFGAVVGACDDGGFEGETATGGGGAGASGGAPGGNGGQGGSGGATGHPAFKLRHAGEEIENGSTFAMPDGMGSDNTAIAIFSELKNPVTIENAGDEPLTVTGVSVAVADGVQAEELRICSIEPTVDQCLPYAPPSLEAAATSDLFFHF
jgi:hypothetical protein